MRLKLFFLVCFSLLAAAAFAQDDPPVRWVGKATLDVSLLRTTVNTDNIGFLLDLNKKGKSYLSTIDAGFISSRQNKSTTAETLFLEGDHRYGLQRKFYGFYNGSLRRDRVQKLDLRSIIGGGVGYHIIDNPNRNLYLESGLSWVNESYIGGGNNSKLALQLGYLFDAKLSSSSTFKNSFTIFPDISDFSNHYWISKTTLSQKLSGTLSFDVNYIIDYTTRPKGGARHSTSQLVIGIAKSF